MGLFYAYVLSANANSSNRWIIAFANRDAADEWWRKMNDIPTIQSGYLKRLTPQLYQYDNSKGYQVYDLITEQESKLFFTALPGRGSFGLTLIPPENITDHISGDTYFIRSQSSPEVYWCVKDDKFLHASRTERTKFRIRIRGNGSEGKVMIGSDDIEIALAFGELKVSTNDSNVLIAGRKAETYKFGDLNGGFLIQGEKGPDACKNHDDANEADKIYKTDRGEVWELVN